MKFCTCIENIFLSSLVAVSAERFAPCPLCPGHKGLMHTLFTLEDNYGLKISEIEGEVCLKVDV